LGKEEKLKEQVALLRRAVARLASALAQPKDEFVRDSAIQRKASKCPRFGFATWGAKARAGEGLFWCPHRGQSRGGVLKPVRALPQASPLRPGPASPRP
jgi:hypothetical protein